MRSFVSSAVWLGSGALLGALLTGCSGASTPTFMGDDGGTDAASLLDSSSGADAVAGQDSTTADGGDGGGGANDATIPSDARAFDGGVASDAADAGIGSDAAEAGAASDAADAGIVNDAADAGVGSDAADGTAPLDGAIDASGTSDGALVDGNDAAVACGDGGGPVPCLNPSTGANDFCGNGVCASCTEVTDDVSCTTAYGSAGHPYLCIGGACIAGECRTDADCVTSLNGPLCGVNTPNACGKCSTDTQCGNAGLDGGASICNATTGACVSAACTNTGKACAANASDICCNGACTAGSCCTTAMCTGNGETCQNNQCSACAPATDNTYYVDPLNGSDTSGVGSGATGGACAFKSITRALQFLGTVQGATTVAVLPTADVGTKETFPITPQANVTIQGATAGTSTTIDVPALSTGIILSAASTGLSNLILNGNNAAGSTGISVTSHTGSLTNVVVKNMGGDGVLVSGGALSIGSSVTSKGNAANGLNVMGTGKVTITANTGDTKAVFDQNDYGIVVKGAGSITIGGTLTQVAEASSNTHAGLFIEQTPGTPPPNVVSNFRADDSVTATGMHVYGGSSLKLRNSWTQGNAANGIWISTYAAGTITSNDVSQIDLGQPTDNGGNTFQYATGASPNAGAGICLDLTPTAGQTLNAAGNKFEAANCATAATTLVKGATCTGGVDYAITGVLTTNTIVLTKCM